MEGGLTLLGLVTEGGLDPHWPSQWLARPLRPSQYLARPHTPRDRWLLPKLITLRKIVEPYVIFTTYHFEE